MKRLLTILMILISGVANAQFIYMDPAVAGAQTAHSTMINNRLKVTDEKLSLIEKGQLAVTAELAVVNTMQEKIYRGLSEVNAVLTNLYEVKEIHRVASGIISDVSDMMAIAKANPQFLVFAEKNAGVFQENASALAMEVSGFVLKGGKDNLMDSGERAKLLNRVLEKLLILRSYSYGMYRSMYFAQMRGFFKSINPFDRYVETDLAIMSDIINKRQYLSR
jgi:hypothetical protein